ncbi:hypothetical protein NBG4_1390001 [Candidatus Sulfobium mesophilum]|uniref:Uncharacterized protein n=1 Tax=Candidatus Sulfobium mesophilum TaxID=2016548 RepID=A0A2U3QF19_9BACT|nr:hypothetical protein NBG4_1390001 [Candidatus Sulfobium mesophilum]
MRIERDCTLGFDAVLFKDVCYDERRVKGYASVEVPDLQNETLLIKGMDKQYA